MRRRMAEKSMSGAIVNHRKLFLTQQQRFAPLYLEKDSHYSYRVDGIIEVVTRQMEIPLQEIDEYQIDEFLRNIDFFQHQDLQEEIILEMIQNLRYEYFKKGDFVYKHGDYGDRFYMILKGRVSVLLSEEQIQQQELNGGDADIKEVSGVESIEIVHPQKASLNSNQGNL